jgi:hypothetical protein
MNDTVRSLRTRLEPFSEALVRSVLPPRVIIALTAEQVHRRFVARVIMVTILIVTNGLLWVELQDRTVFRSELATAAVAYIEGSLVLDLLISWRWLRRENRHYGVAAAVASAISVATIPVWMQLTGLTTSYLAAVPGIFIVVVRVTYSYWTGLTAAVTVLLVYLGAFLLEQHGVLPSAPILLSPPGGVLAAPAFRQLVASSTVTMYVFGHLLGNLIVYQLTRQEQILRAAREQLRRAVDQARLGRLSGTRLGDYSIDDLLGRGGMGEVYSARHVRGNDQVAIKLLHAHLGGDQRMRMRFRREAEVVSKMPAGTVAHVHQFGTTEEGYDYIVMERLRGEDMGALLKRRERLGLDEVVHIVDKVARGLDAAHDQGVVHRDLKPQNVFICGELETGQPPDVRLLDFGVARLHEAVMAQTMTATAAVLGTPGYMPPEQATGGEVGPSVDLFALGAIVYRAITGKPAFPSRSPEGALFEALHHHPPPASESTSGLPRDVDAVIEIALAKDAKQRYQRASEMARDLAAAARAELSDSSRKRAAALLAARAEFTGTMTSG